MPKGICNATGHGNKFVHGLASKPWTKLYRTWVAVRNRCGNPNNPSYPYYGGRGIKVCSRWDDYENFAADMGEPPTPKHTIERRDSNGHYEPDNCYWATRKVQSTNRDYCVLKPDKIAEIKRLREKFGYTQQQLADMFGVTQVRISQVLRWT